MRAAYGGALLGIGATLQLLGSKPETRNQGLYALIAILGCMALGRVVGMIVDGQVNVVMYIFLAYELVFAILSVVFLSRKSVG